MAIPRQHYAYADALIAGAIREYGEKGSKASKRGMISRAKGPEKASETAAINHDKKLRPTAPRSWNVKTAKAINRNIQSTVWKEAKAAYRKAKRKKADLKVPLDGMPGTETMLAGILGAGASGAGGGPGSGLSRRTVLAGVTIISASCLLYAAGDAFADNRAYIAEARGDIRDYVKSKRPQIERAMEALFD